MKGMTGKQGQILLLAFFPLIFIPAFILAYFAFGAVNQDEIIQRRRLEDNLFLELDQTNSRIGDYLEEMQEDFTRACPRKTPTGKDGPGIGLRPSPWREPFLSWTIKAPSSIPPWMTGTRRICSTGAI